MASVSNPPELNVTLHELEREDLQKPPKPWDDGQLPIDILLLTVHDCDLLSCASHLNPRFYKNYHKDLGNVYFGNIGEAVKLKVALMQCASATGNPTHFAIQVNHITTVLKPKAVFSVGHCGSLIGQTAKLGDVVVSAKLRTYAPVKGTENGIVKHDFMVAPKRLVLNLIRKAGEAWKAPLPNPGELEVTVHYDGLFLNGPELVESQERCAQLIQQFPAAIAIECEGEGVYTVAKDQDVEWIIIKGIADYADDSKSENWKWCASVMAASFTANILRDPTVSREWSQSDVGTQISPTTPNSLSPSNSFDSRFLTDFEHDVLLLGKGGSGLVFQAKKKLDGYQYAIKRIKLPNCDEASEKVKREVKALAKLEHPSIVRYYNSWFEAPPVGWQKERDVRMFRQGTFSGSSSEVPSVDSGVQQHGDSEDSAFQSIGLNLPASVQQHGDSEDSAFQSIVFGHSGSNQTQDVSNTDSRLRSRDTSSSEEMPFTSSSHHSLLSIKKHKCQNKNCSATGSAPLYFYIQMQLCQQKNLKDWLEAGDKRDHVFCLKVFEQILCAVECFHGSGLMHRDLKPGNIFFLVKDKSVKVGDFGLVTAYTSENDMDTPLKGAPMDDMKHTAKVGTKLYMSPEQLKGKAYSHKVDIFSLGLILFELFCPFGTQMERIEVMRGVKEGNIPSDFEANKPLHSKLVQWLLSARPEDRPNATEVRNSDLLKQMNEGLGIPTA